jgi:RNA 3'-terminal phosphate cyclase
VDAKNEALAADIAKRLSPEMFAGAPVDVHLCDRKLKTFSVAKDR